MDYKAMPHIRFFRFIGGRLLLTIVTAFLVAAIVFFVVRSVPGDPALNVLGLQSTEAEREALRRVMGLNLPILSQFFIWLGNVIRGNFGYSYSQGEPVAAVIAPALNNTLMLGGCAAVLAIIIALLMGNAATSRWRGLRRTTDWVEAAFLSAPQYTVALILLICFAVLLPIFPAGGVSNNGDGSFPDVARHLFLPALALALAPGAQMGRALKTSIAGLQATELLPSLKARGLSPWRVSVHAHHNALPPMITVLGIQVGSMLGGALFIENIFSIQGLGALIVQAVGLRDYALVEAVALLIAVIFIIVLLLADVINALLDPRIRLAR